MRLGYHDRTLVGLERTREGFRAIRLRLTRDGRGVTAAEVLDDGIDTAGPSATSIVADTLYYLAQEEDGAVVIRRVRLR